MKQIYQLFAAATVVVAGATNLAARNWTPGGETVTADQVKAGSLYVLKGLSPDGSEVKRYLQGDKFVEKSNVSPDGVFEFEAVEGLENVFFLKVHGRTTNQYVATPGSNNFFTSSKHRAWKVMVKAAQNQDKNHKYDWPTHTAAGTDTTVALTGLRAYIQESIDASSETPKVNAFDLSTVTWQNISDASVIVSYQSKNPNKVEKDAEFNFLLTNSPSNLTPGKGTDYDRNSWLILDATENSARDALLNMLSETFGDNFDLDGLTNSYVIGEKIGQYSQAKFDAFKTLYDRAQAAKAEGSTATDTELDELTDKLPKAFAEFKQSAKPLTEGYYIVQSYRGIKEKDYDGGALYDEAAVNPKGKNLKWTFKGKDNITYNPQAELDYNSLKFIWKVEKDEQHPGYFFFKNMYTNRYIGDTPEKKQNQVPQMTDTPVISYNIVSNRNQPGFYSFYSPQLWKGAGNYWGYNGGDRWEYGGLHTGGDHNNVVVWNWQDAPSAFQTTELTEEKVKALLSVAEQGMNNDKAKALVNEAQTAIDRGYQYMAVDEAGTRLEYANSGDFSTDKDPGLVTSADQLKSPMGDKQEGTDLNKLLDGDASTFFHSTWHGDADAWKGGHYLQFQLGAPQTELMLKWVKRDNGNWTNGPVPSKVTLWGAKTDEALAKDKEDKTNDDGTAVTDFDAWKKQGWDSLGVASFSYPYAIKIGDATKNNFAGFAHFKVPEGYKNFRMEVIDRIGDGPNPDGKGNRYFSGAEFRVYKGAFDNVNSLIASVPTADVEALKAAIAKVNGELKDSKATKESIAELQAAYDKFLKNYPEPTRVSDALTAAKAIEKAAEPETDNKTVGYYKAGAKETLKAVIDKVETEFNTQKAKQAPSVDQINNYIAQLDAALAEFAKNLIMPESGIYRIKSSSAEKERAGRMVTAVNSSRESNLKMRGRVDSKVNKGQYEDESGFESVLGSYWDVQKVDTGYTLKNLYTGLYASPKGSMMTQVDTPYVFKVQFAKYPGSFNLVARESDVDSKKIYMNAEADNLVLWNSATGQDNSAFEFVPATDMLAESVFDAGYGKITTYVDAKKLQIVTLPFNAKFDKSQGSFYTVIGQDASNKIQLKKVADDTVLEAGVAYIYEPTAENNENKLYLGVPTGVTDYTKMVYTHTPKAAANGLVPVFEHTKLNIDNGIFNNDRTMVLLSEDNDKAWANTGYFTKMPQTDQKGDKEIEAEALITALRNVLIVNGTAAKAGVYTLSGVRVNNTNNLPAGVYIVNGQKQVVK